MMRGVEPGAGGELIPEVVAVLAPGGDVARGGRRRLGDVIEHLLGERRLDRDVDGGDVDARPVRHGARCARPQDRTRN